MNIKKSYDVIVIGGGTAGVCAATQSALAGAQTLLVEKNSLLGGTITSAGVNIPGLFHAWGRQIIAGIGWEIVKKCVEMSGDKLPDFSVIPDKHWQHQVRVDRLLFAALCDETVLKSGADLLLHSMIAAIDDDNNIKQITICTKEGLVKFQTKVLVDCTGDANAASLAGCELRKSEEVQPGTLIYEVTGFDLDNLDIDKINRNLEAEIIAGNLTPTDIGWNTANVNIKTWLACRGYNKNHLHGLDSTTSANKTAMEIEARKSLLSIFSFLKTQPGLEKLKINYFAPECGIRETATIIGEKTITVDDYTSGRTWGDSVCYSFYPVDLHTSNTKGLKCEPLKPGTVPTVPRGAMLPQNSSNIIVAGRCVSSDQLANSALRVQASCMAMGQAAGAIAALSSKMDKNPEELPMDEIKTNLTKNGAIVP